MDPGRGDGGGRVHADELEEDPGAEWEDGPMDCDHRHGAGADDAELLGR